MFSSSIIFAENDTGDIVNISYLLKCNKLNAIKQHYYLTVSVNQEFRYNLAGSSSSRISHKDLGRLQSTSQLGPQSS